MLKIKIIAVGKDKDDWVTGGIHHFEKLLSRKASIEWHILAGAPSSLSPAEIRKSEGTKILAKLPKGLIVALHDRGTTCDSIEFSRQLQAWMNRCQGVISFVIGGPHGLDNTVLQRSDVTLSMSSLTFSHQVVRLVLLEQLFRAFSILGGTDYHK